MKLTFGNYSEQKRFDGSFPVSWSEFVTYKPSPTQIKKQFAPFLKYKNYIVIGNGGSISSLNGYWGALGVGSKKNLAIVDSMEPDYLRALIAKYKSATTLVVAISKSGTTVGVIEALLAFKGYPTLVITSIGEGTLSAIAQKMGWPQIEHPAIGGRFTGRTAVAYGPAYLVGIDIESIERGAAEAVKANTSTTGPAWRLAKYLYERELKKENDIYMPVYSHFLAGFNHLVMQLMHESVAKNGKGQTILAVRAPESQHHTNQRYFGGRRNMASIFVTVKKPLKDIVISVPEKITEVSLRGEKLEELQNAYLHNSLLCEARGTMGDALEQNISFSHIQLEQLTPAEVGKYLVLWQFVAYYSALLRGVNPLDQPSVERSKEIAMELRK